jgi:hypothetical protein
MLRFIRMRLRVPVMIAAAGLAAAAATTAQGARMRRHHLAVLRGLLCCAPVALAAAGVTSRTAGAPVACAGQCAPPYELQVLFRTGTSDASAQWEVPPAS